MVNDIHVFTLDIIRKQHLKLVQNSRICLPFKRFQFKHVLLNNQMDWVTGKAYVNPLQNTKSNV